MKYQEEVLTEDFAAEIYPLLVAHYEEIAHYKDIELDIDWVSYFKLQSAGMLKVLVAREDDGKLAGYAVFFILPNMHYKSSVQAKQDILYLAPDHRGKMVGAKLITESEKMLIGYDVEIVYHHVKKAHDFSPLLDRLGYDLVETVHSKRLK